MEKILFEKKGEEVKLLKLVNDKLEKFVDETLTKIIKNHFKKTKKVKGFVEKFKEGNKNLIKFDVSYFEY